MDNNKKTLQDIFDDADEFGLLDVKPTATSAVAPDERAIAAFQDVNAFYEKHGRLPLKDKGIQEFTLLSRLETLQNNPEKVEILRGYDRFNLLNATAKKVDSMAAIFDDADDLGLFGDDTEGLFDFKHIKKPTERVETDFVARRKPCADFEQYEARFKAVQADLKQKKRTIVAFKQDNLREGAFYLHNGLLFFIEKMEITKQEHYRPDGTRVRADGRTRCIFENGTESNMLKRSVEKILYTNGQAISENADTAAELLADNYNHITEADKAAGYIYILQSKSTISAIKSLQNLYKIGYSTTSVEERIKNAAQETTYLMADVSIKATYKCFNMNPQKFEQLVHSFFGHVCLNIDVFDRNGQRYTPREWFIAPIGVIDKAIDLIQSGEILAYRYDEQRELIVKRSL
jgi:hypothetical protein